MPRKYVPAMYWDQDTDTNLYAVLDTDTSVWYFGEDSEEGAQALADELNECADEHNMRLARGES